MRRASWGWRLAAIGGVALLAAAAAVALPDNPYQRWQLVETTLYANATWSYERIHFDPRSIDVAILGSSRSQMGLGAPRIAARLAALGHPVEVANLSVIEDGRNIEWAVARELFTAKRPRLLVVLVSETPNRWGHPGFKYVAPAAAVVAPPSPLLHNFVGDLAYLPYRQMMLFAASLAPDLVGLRDRFDPAAYAAKTSDYSHSHTLADGKHIDMETPVDPDTLRAEAQSFAAWRRPSDLPPEVSRLTEIDNRVYLDAIARLAAEHGARLLFVFLPEFAGETAIEDRAGYARLGGIVDCGDLATDASLYQSFAHLNRRGADIASDRVADAIASVLGSSAAGARVAGGGRTT